MQVSPINFCARFRYEIEKEGGLSDAEADSEMLNAEKARNSHVRVPQYYSDGYILRYRTNGENPDYQTNPMNDKHLDWLFTEFYKMDKANINHRSLDREHIFLNPNGRIELDCFRYAVPFIEKDSSKTYNLPDFIPPSNQPNYEASALTNYISQMSNKKEAIEFLKKYISKSAILHSVKARIANTLEQKDYENLLGRVFKNPDDKMADLYFDKVQFLNQRKLAKDMYHQGVKNGITADRDKCTQSVLTYIDTIELLRDYALKATIRKAETKDEDKKTYYDYEVESAKYYADSYLKEIRLMLSRDMEYVDNDYARYIYDIFNDIEGAIFDNKTRYIDEFKKLCKIAHQI